MRTRPLGKPQSIPSLPASLPHSLLPSTCCLHSLPSGSPRHLLALQYQVGGEAQVGCAQQGYQAEVGGVGEAGQVADHEVEVDGADQCHD